MTAAAADYKSEPREGTVSLREVITDTPFGNVTYVMTIDGALINISRDEDIVADVTFSQAYSTAVELHRGELTTHDAFFSGKVRVAGHLNTLLEHSDLLKGVSPAFESVRAQTTYQDS